MNYNLYIHFSIFCKITDAKLTSKTIQIIGLKKTKIRLSYFSETKIILGLLEENNN